MPPIDFLSLITLLNIGFSVISACVLFVAYVGFIQTLNKSAVAVISCGLLLASLCTVQILHIAPVFFDTAGTQAEPLNQVFYRFLLFLMPPMFYFFSRSVLFPEKKFGLLNMAQLLPLVLPFFLKKEIAVPIAFMIGTGYSLWLANIIYNLKENRQRFRLEFFYFSFFALLAVFVLVFGFSVFYMESRYFYMFYACGIGVAFALVVGGLISFPEMLEDVTEAVKLSYSKSTLSSVDVESKLQELQQQLIDKQLYQDEALSLTSLASAIGLSGHQLSELINTRFKMSFSQYIRQLRVERAKQLLKAEPDASILAISLETGFRSQSNFYSAFKEITGQSPGSYRKLAD